MEFKEFIDKYNVKLNDQQLEAVTSVNGPVLLLAVPGSGKTTTLIARLGYMIYCEEIKPENILTVTYTVAATKDMTARFAKVFGTEMAERMEFRTINGICSKIMYQYGKKIGKKPFELLTDERIISNVLVQIWNRYSTEYPTETDIKALRTAITYIKNMMLDDNGIKDVEWEYDSIPLLNAYHDYCSVMKNSERIDYDDQMVYAYKILKNDSDMLAYYSDLYQYICVDESQDTSKIQHAIISLIASKNENLFMVGDEDQSIYGFRAAYPQALLDFEKDHPGAKVLLMEQNYRSNEAIVEAADRFIQKNTLRHKKNIKATMPRESDVEIVQVPYRREQFEYLKKVAKDCCRQTAVLYRENDSSIPLIDLLERENIPYNMKGADYTFFTNRVIVDMENIMRFALNPRDTDLFMQIYYKIGLYLNKNAAEYLCANSRTTGGTILSGINNLSMLKENVKRNCQKADRLFKIIRNTDAVAAITLICTSLNYSSYLDKNKIDDSKLFILTTLAKKEKNVEGLLKRVSDLNDIIRNKVNDGDAKFILSTIHSSKGLEYDDVYMIDVADEIFPKVVTKATSADEKELAQYEEERRMFYVGVTRAKHNLYIFDFKQASSFRKDLFPRKNASARKSTKHQPSDITYGEFSSKLTKGARIRHLTNGSGVVIAVKDDKVVVRHTSEGTAGDIVYSIPYLFKNDLLTFT